MTAFRPDTSFPYFKVAREYGVDYGDVIRFAEAMDGWGIPVPCNIWQQAVASAWLAEYSRRSEVKLGLPRHR